MAKRLTTFSRFLISTGIIVITILLVRSCFVNPVVKPFKDEGRKEAFSSKYQIAKEELRESIVETLNSRNISSVLIAEYDDLDKNRSKFGRYLAEDLSSILSSNSNNFIIVDRSRINDLIKERNLNDAGFLAPNTVSELGKAIGVEAIITGKYQKVGDYLKIWIRIIDIEKGELIFNEDLLIELQGELENAIG